tara:strand:+ start:13023 stop:14078 length:1056 start_codon:yes stop_codon:yes gene_type:complete
MFKIAVVGAGVFGSTCALRLSNIGHECVLFEKKDSILSCASRVNQYRLHKGYHYPRGNETVTQLSKSSRRFEEEFSSAINYKMKNIYALAAEKSLVNTNQYIDFLRSNSLDYRIIPECEFLKSEMFSSIFEVNEGLINFFLLKNLLTERIKNSKNLRVKLKTEFNNEFADEFDFIIICTYGLSSQLLPKKIRREYKYQLIEKPVVMPPLSLRNKSIVIIDGPFMCIDPMIGTDLSVLGNVKHAVYQTSFGYQPDPISSEFKINPWEDIKDCSKSRFHIFIEHGGKYIRDFEKCEFKFSMTGYRVVNINREKTDDRPTYINNFGKYFEVSSGKIDTCSWAADQLVNLIEDKK